MNVLDDLMMAVEDLEDDDPLRFWAARDSDHLLIPFQCDCCHFPKCEEAEPVGVRSLRPTVHAVHLESKFSWILVKGARNHHGK
jgi:hypothetical protein